MFEIIKDLRSHGIQVGILSDQTHWLDELNDRFDFFKWFDHVFSSYHMGKSKKDSSVFDDIAKTLNRMPEKILFVDDHEGNCKRARTRALNTILYVDGEQFIRELEKVCPFVDAGFYNVFM
jgi:putative hydrolase of the HAD superfamily